MREVRDGALLRNRALEAAVPGLVCGITTAPAGSFSISASSGDELLRSYEGLAGALGFRVIAVPRQVHGTEVEHVLPGGEDFRGASRRRVRVLLAGRVDGLVGSAPGVLLASTAADCVPISIADPAARIAGLVHAGWRGASAGILAHAVERTLEAGGALERLLVHLGPAICGNCYEVDRPVLDAFGVEADRALLDLRGRLVEDALEAGLRAANITVSTLCTRCGPEDLHSHRGSGGKAGRMAAFTGFRGG